MAPYQKKSHGTWLYINEGDLFRIFHVFFQKSNFYTYILKIETFSLKFIRKKIVYYTKSFVNPKFTRRKIVEVILLNF